MDLLPTVLSAVAASVAAVFAGVNLYLSGRREHVKWARDALVETFRAFLDASFQSKDAVKAAVRLSWSGGDPGRLAELRREAVAVEHEMRRLQTRLRLLTSSEVVASAHALRSAVAEYVAVLDAIDPVSAETDRELRRRLWTLREAFIAAAKGTLAL
ncbi:hypothetical protein [Planosporangium mesophilum]|uniref:Uncharacterized protein n=1 Tax=Planosporangium mesophilum TaxID=689768 RepID=A0A8J3X2G1_9ACTN|nr:hypothetical protein [Planosporangium mesophilum]NJC85219.1 hypothetical protein [Planosporangium mesophilum]GII24364.1 hypothetical protein Pme01_39610 [Planosporangium mesophilum]